jgi:serine protease
MIPSHHSLLRRACCLALGLAAVPAMAGTAGTSALRANTLTNRFIVTYRTATPIGTAAQTVATALARTTLANASGKLVARPTTQFVRRLATGADVVRTSRKLGKTEAIALMQQIAADPSVKTVQPDVRRFAVREPATRVLAAADFVPNDPDYAQYQWDYFNDTGGVRAPAAWQLSRGAGVVVAVLDTGITAHPDIDLSLASAGYDFISDGFISGRATDDRAPGGWDTGDWSDTEPYVTECGSAGEASSWHGTHVAGTVAERADNGIGLAGLAHLATVLPVRVLGHCGGYDSDIADAIVWAAGGHVDGVPDNTHPAQVINMSLGGGGACADSPMHDAIALALARGTAVVVAAGNDTDDAAGYAPASCPGAIVVGATGITGKEAFYSNYGSTVTVAAPGGGIYVDDDPATGATTDDGFVWSTVDIGATTPQGPAYAGYAGTSQATPHVAAAVAMVQSGLVATGLDPLLPASLKQLVASSARAFPVAEPHPLGSGILDVAAALAAAGVGGTIDPSVPVLTSGRVTSGARAAAGQSVLYRLAIPYGSANASIRTLGGSGGLTLYLKRGTPPAVDGSDADFVAARAGTSQVVVLPASAAGIYYARLVAVPSFAAVSVLAAVTAPRP